MEHFLRINRMEKYMNQNTKEALILELTKAKVGKQHIDNPTNTNLTKAEFWIESYLEAEKEIEEAVDRLITEN